MTWTSENGKWHIRLQPVFYQDYGRPKGIGTFSTFLVDAMIHETHNRKPHYYSLVPFESDDAPRGHAKAARARHVPNYVADQLAVMIEDYRKEHA